MQKVDGSYDNGYYLIRVKRLFWAAAVATVVDLSILTWELLGFGSVYEEITYGYFLVLCTYAVINQAYKWRDRNKQYAGEWFVFSIWIFFGIIALLSAYTNTKLISAQFYLTFKGVTYIFFGTSTVQILRFLTLGKSSKE